jgi:hypothetical protein
MFERKVYRLSNGNQIIFHRNPPFSFWTVNYAKGGLPGHLRGNYTHFNQLYKKVEAYLNTKNVTIGEEETWHDPQEQ